MTRVTCAICEGVARTVQSFDVCVFMGTVSLPSSMAPGYGTVGCVGVLVTKSYLCLSILVRCMFLMVMFVVPELGFIMFLSWVTPGTHFFYNCSSTGD